MMVTRADDRADVGQKLQQPGQQPQRQRVLHAQQRQADPDGQEDDQSQNDLAAQVGAPDVAQPRHELLGVFAVAWLLGEALDVAAKARQVGGQVDRKHKDEQQVEHRARRRTGEAADDAAAPGQQRLYHP